jgi:CheY-like chemotaxis protein
LARRFAVAGEARQDEVIDVAAMLTELRKEATEGFHLAVRLQVHSPLPKVQGDAFELRQVMRDIIENAAEAMKDKPKPQLSVRAGHDPLRNRVEVEFADKGSGIPDSLRGRLFTPGTSTKKGSFGIGLWSCKTVMQAMGGDIRLKNTARRGTTFALDLHCPPQEGAHTAPDVLIVDDDERWRSVLRDYIPKQGYSVLLAASTTEARQLLREHRFKLAVLDISLVHGDDTNVDGLRLAEEIADAKLNTKVILITGWGSAHKQQAAAN